MTTSYRQALRGRWLVIVITALVITLLAAVAPPAPVSYPQLSTRLVDLGSPARAKFQATSVIGVPPIVSGGDATVQFKTIAFYVQSTGVGDAFAKRLGYTGGDYAMLARLIVITSDDKAGTMTVKGYGGTRKQAAAITNAFTASLRDYLSGLGTQASQQSLQQAQAAVKDLQKRIDDLSAQIATLRASGITSAQAANNPQVTQLQAQHDALVQSYTAAYQHMTSVSAGGGVTLATAGIADLQPARAATAERLGPGFLYELWVRILLGLIVGVALGVALALLLEHNARKIFNRDAAEHAFGARVLAEIPRHHRTGTSRDVAVITAPGSRTASAYRMLRVVLLSEVEAVAEAEPVGSARGARHTRPALARGRTRELSATQTEPPSAPAAAGTASTGNGAQTSGNPLSAPSAAAHVPFDRQKVTLVVAAAANEPTHAAVVANMAATFVVAGQPVTVLRLRVLARGADVPPADDEQAADGPPSVPASRETSVAGVRLVEWQPVYGGPSAAEVLERVQAGGDVVLVDTGRVATAEFAEVAPLIDGVVAVCQIRRTTVENAERTADIVAWSHARLFGVVLTQVPAKAVERVTWGRWRRSPLTSGRGLRRVPWQRRMDADPGDERRDDQLGLLDHDGTPS